MNKRPCQRAEYNEATGNNFSICVSVNVSPALQLDPLLKSLLSDAANDAHAGYVIYSRLLNMARAMDPVPLPTYYSFSLIDGHLRDSLGISPWHPHNPYYDPGPPPPPKPKNPEKNNQEPTGLVPVVSAEPRHSA